MSEQKRKALLGILLAALAGTGLVVGVHYLPQSSTSPRSEVNSTTLPQLTTEEILGGFSISGVTPLLVASPQNHTFMLNYTVTTDSNVLLSYDEAYSYAVLYSSNTQWLNTSRPCEGTVTTSPSTEVTTAFANASVVTYQQIPCGQPNGQWYPAGGSVVDSYLGINSTDVQVNVDPASIAAHSTERVSVSLSIQMNPGVYAINLAVDVQTSGSPPIQYLLGYTPLVEQA